MADFSMHMEEETEMKLIFDLDAAQPVWYKWDVTEARQFPLAALGELASTLISLSYICLQLARD